VTSFRGTPSTDGFPKRYELHYQLKKMEVDRAILEAQFGCLNFHAKWYKGSGLKVTIVVKNKWSVGWTRTWFYCKVPLLQSPQGEKGVYALHSPMSALDCDRAFV
jgi:hypothetical protein